MRLSRTRLFPLLAAGALAAVVGTTTAGAAPGPVPGCAGITVKDPAGDQTANQQEAPPNTDIKELFFRNDGGVTTANIRLAEVSKTVPTPYSAVIIYVLWNYADPADPAVTDGYASARINSDGTTEYAYGTLATGSGFKALGESTGALAEGTDGVISIVIPPAAVPADKKLPAPIVDARLGVSEPVTGRGVVSRADFTSDGKTYAYGGCKDGETATPTTAPTPAPGGGTGGGGTTPTTGPTPAPGGGSTPAKAPITIDITKAKAKGKVVSIGLRSSEALSGLKGTLKKGKKKVGTGKLAKLGSTGTIKLKGKKKMKKGTYSFALTAKDSSGQPVKATFSVRVK
jgi:hypothetical protein